MFGELHVGLMTFLLGSHFGTGSEHLAEDAGKRVALGSAFSSWPFPEAELRRAPLNNIEGLWPGLLFDSNRANFTISKGLRVVTFRSNQTVLFLKWVNSASTGSLE